MYFKIHESLYNASLTRMKLIGFDIFQDLLGDKVHRSIGFDKIDGDYDFFLYIDVKPSSVKKIKEKLTIFQKGFLSGSVYSRSCKSV